MVNIASYQVKPEDVITVRKSKQHQERINLALDLHVQRGLAEWVELDADKKTAVYRRLPERSELSQEIHENLIVELYSK